MEEFLPAICGYSPVMVVKVTPCLQTRDSVKAAQENDPKCGDIISVLQKNEPETSRER